MKPFIIWLVLTIILFGAISVSYHVYLESHPQKILVAVDASFPMKTVWSQVPQKLHEIENRRYALYCLITDKNRIHDWSSRLQLGTIAPYAPQDLSKLLDSSKYSEIEEAGEKYLITTSDAAQLNQFNGWTIISLTPLSR